MLLKKKLLVMFLFFFIINCSEKTYFSGTIINEDLNYNKFTNKKELIDSLGNPNFIDIIENKYYYYNEITLSENLFKEVVKDRLILVFLIKDEKIISLNKYKLNDKKKLKIMKETTKSSLIETGIIKKIFGGLSPSNMTNTSN